MQLSVPIDYKDGVYDQCEFKKPKPGFLANALEVFQNQGDFPAILDFLANSITSFTSTEGKVINAPDQIRAICRRMPYVTADVIAIQIMLLINKDDWIEGVYACPRCKKEIITGVNNDTGEDNRDRILDLEIVNQGENEIGEIDSEEYNSQIFVELMEPVKILHAKTGEALHEIESFHMRYPTLDDCIKGGNKYPQNKEAKRQFAIYAEALEKINGEEIKVKWKKTWGEFIFREIDSDDLQFIGQEMQKYGMKRQIEKTCRHCGKTWMAPVNTSNFFESGLQSV